MRNKLILLGGSGGNAQAVLGPASGGSTDNAIVRWDTTTGRLVQNSVLTIDDTTGNLSGFTTGNGVTFHGGGTVTGASGALSFTASGTNQNVNITPSGSGVFNVTGAATFSSSIDAKTNFMRGSQLIVSDGVSGSRVRITSTADGVAVFSNSTSSGFSKRVYSPEGSAASDVVQIKAITGIADNTATSAFTVTIPNAAHSATVRVTLCGSLGAGGAIGANEATGTITYDFSIARTLGVNAVVGTSTAFGSSSAAVTGAATITITGSASAVSGAVGATNTFNIQVTIAHGSGASTNHTCCARAELINANSSGITIA